MIFNTYHHWFFANKLHFQQKQQQNDNRSRTWVFTLTTLLWYLAYFIFYLVHVFIFWNYSRIFPFSSLKHWLEIPRVWAFSLCKFVLIHLLQNLSILYKICEKYFVCFLFDCYKSERKILFIKKWTKNPLSS